eukprot:1016008-Prymnesium_polylepis.2
MRLSLLPQQQHPSDPRELRLLAADSQVKTRGEADKAREPALLAARHIVYRTIAYVKESVVARHVRQLTDKSKRNHEARRQPLSNPRGGLGRQRPPARETRTAAFGAACCVPPAE